MKFKLFISLLFVFLGKAFLGQSEQRNISINWQPSLEINGNVLMNFEGAKSNSDHLPIYNESIKLKKGRKASFKILDFETSPINKNESIFLEDKSISETIELIVNHGAERFTPYVSLGFLPIIKRDNQYLKVVDLELEFKYETTELVASRSKSFATSSVLASGDWYKIAVNSDGIYKIDKNFLASFGIDMDNVNPQHINIYGNGAGALPESNSEFRQDDLAKNAISFQGNELDGVFDDSDFILFYAHGPNSIEENGQEFFHKLNTYSDTSYYFIHIDGSDAPKRMASQNQSGGTITNVVTSFDDFEYRESEQVNFWESGQTWYGDIYNNILSSYNYSFSFPNITTDSIKVNARSVGKSFVVTSFSYSCFGKTVSSSIPAISPMDSYTAAKAKTAELYAVPNSSSFNVNVNFNQGGSGSSEGWLDYLTINARRNLKMSGNSMLFSDFESVGAGNVSNYIISSASAVGEIWEVTDFHNISKINYTTSGSNKEFAMTSDTLRKYIAVSTNLTNSGNTALPFKVGRIENQNLHALPNADYIIVAPGQFISQANELANLHRNNGLSVHVVNVNHINNEFSSGMRDAIAIRQFLRMFYTRAAGDPNELPKYLLMFGDGNYDNKGKKTARAPLPTFQSTGHLSKLSTYTSDDYFVVLDDNESFSNSDKIDVAVGRFPVGTSAEADNVVQKVKNYLLRSHSYSPSSTSVCGDVSNPTTHGNWKNKIMLVSDDEDGDLFLNHTEQVISKIRSNYPEMNINTVHSDAFTQYSTPGGERYPDVNDEIKTQVQNGVFTVNYIGHGGEIGWSGERILDLTGINEFSNTYRLPIFMTATCSFSRFDDPDRTSGGEKLLLNPNGGSIAMFTTWRLVFAGPNLTLNKAFYDTVYKRHPNGEPQTIGEIYMATKNIASTDENARKFGLLGDPGLQLALPRRFMHIDSINGTGVTQPIDTLKALSKVSLKGKVTDYLGNLESNFNGTAYITVYDKYKNFLSLGNNNTAQIPFQEQSSILYKGKAKVNSGRYSFEFIVPKDIDFQIGDGKLSLYADNDEIDAMGYYDTVKIGGTNPNPITDGVGPEITLYLNDSSFVYGGLTNETPILLAYFVDSSGINTVGNSIGHDVSAVIDGNTSEELILNDFYEADVNSYQKGKVAYQLEALSEGTHTLEVKGWDVYNNSSTSQTEFVVASSAELALDHVLNYPNPFTTSTEFMLEHNAPCNSLDIQIQIFTVAGNLVKTINENIHTEGFRVSGIKWNGTDDFGDRLARGVYVYKVKVRTPDGVNAEKYEKLVILK